MSDQKERKILLPNLRIFAIFALATFCTLFMSPLFGFLLWLKASLLAGVFYMLYGFVLGFPIRAVIGNFENPGVFFLTVLVLMSSVTTFSLVTHGLLPIIIGAYALLDSLFFAAVWTCGVGIGFCPEIKTFFPEKVS